MIPALITSPLRVFLGTIYPAYASYKAVRTKTVSNLYKWTIYWIVFAFLSSLEGFADVLIGFWLPFYEECKILIHLWLIFPVSQRSLGSGVIYQRFIHRNMVMREKHIDRSISKFKEISYEGLLQLSMKAANFVKDFFVNLIVNVPVYVQQLVGTNGNANGNKVSLESVSGFFQSVMNNLASNLAANEDQYDNERFEEINNEPEVEVIEFDDNTSPMSEEYNKTKNRSQAETEEIKKVPKGRKQPKRKATVKNYNIDESSETEIDA